MLFTGNGWQWGPLEGLGELSLCVNAEPYRDYCIQPPCGQLNPLNNNTFEVLGKYFNFDTFIIPVIWHFASTCSYFGFFRLVVQGYAGSI